MKYRIKIEKEEYDPDRSYNSWKEIYEQVIEVTDQKTTYMTTTGSNEITPLNFGRNAEELVKDVIKAVNQF